MIKEATRENVLMAVNAESWGTASAVKRGRNPLFPYVPVITYQHSNVPGKTRQQQVLGFAYETRAAAIEKAEATIAGHREDTIKKLLDPRYRAMRSHWGFFSHLAGEQRHG